MPAKQGACVGPASHRCGADRLRDCGCCAPAADQTPDRPSDFEGGRRQSPVPCQTVAHSPHLAGRPGRTGRPALAGLAARSAARRPKTTVALWLGLIVAYVFLGSAAGMGTLSNSRSGVGESARADARVTVRVPSAAIPSSTAGTKPPPSSARTGDPRPRKPTVVGRIAKTAGLRDNDRRGSAI